MSQSHAVEFTKYHGTGNDFIVVAASDAVPDRRSFARIHCDRETGIAHPNATRRGADGVLFLAIEEAYTPSRVVMTLVQPDGSTAAMCGNGARCVAAWAHDRTGETEFMIDTMAGTRHAIVDASGSLEEHHTQHDAEPRQQDGMSVEIEMGQPAFAPAAIPVDLSALSNDSAGTDPVDEKNPLVEMDVDGLVVTPVNTGVPHVVAFVDPDELDDVDLDAVARPVRHAPIFPEGVNVNLAARTDRDGPVFRQRTYERGVERETQSCGTGAVAVAAVARRLGRVEGNTVWMQPPGGELEITLPDRGPARLQGPVEREFSGELPADPR